MEENKKEQLDNEVEKDKEVKTKKVEKKDVKQEDSKKEPEEIKEDKETNKEKDEDKKDKNIGKRILKIVLIIVLVLVLLVIVHTARNYIIMGKLQDKYNYYGSKINYCLALYSNQSGTMQRSTKLVSGNKSKSVVDIITNEGERRKVTVCSDGNKCNEYMEIGKAKIAYLNQDNSLLSDTSIVSALDYMSSNDMRLLMSLTTFITSEKVDDTDCYKIRYNKDFIVYVDKETGLDIKEQNGTIEDENGNKTPCIYQKVYEFDTVTDDMLTEPDVSQYEVIESNDNN